MYWSLKIWFPEWGEIFRAVDPATIPCCSIGDSKGFSPASNSLGWSWPEVDEARPRPLPWVSVWTLPLTGTEPSPPKPPVPCGLGPSGHCQHKHRRGPLPVALGQPCQVGADLCCGRICWCLSITGSKMHSCSLRSREQELSFSSTVTLLYDLRHITAF